MTEISVVEIGALPTIDNASEYRVDVPSNSQN